MLAPRFRMHASQCRRLRLSTGSPHSSHAVHASVAYGRGCEALRGLASSGDRLARCGLAGGAAAGYYGGAGGGAGGGSSYVEGWRKAKSADGLVVFSWN
ncbi:MAG TPA: hypothetical protein VMT95_01600 [Candidatus Binatia bacterium]|nr:hypothetical protein [Candidatus Binatia bacterium]